MLNRLLGLTLSCLVPALAHADLLDDFAAKAGHQGQFSQRVLDTSASLLAESSGDFALLKPGLFRWDIKTPDSQLLLLDGESLWQLDRDLDTLIRRPAPDTDTSPLQLLTTDRETLDARYTVEETDSGLRITPLAPSDYFKAVTIEQEADNRYRLSIDDTLGQIIEITLMLDAGTIPSATLFQFEPPDGVEWLEGAPTASSGNR